MAILKHTHKYQREEAGKKGWIFYRCILQGCSHYLPVATMIIGKESLCHGTCDGTVIYSTEDFTQKLKRPMCKECREIRKFQREQLTSVVDSNEIDEAFEED